jgi:hypothetical protein
MRIPTSDVRVNFADGSELKAFESFTLREAFTDPLGSLQFMARPPLEQVTEYAQRLQKGELCGVMVDGKPQAAMMIQTVRTTVDANTGVSFQVDAVTPLKLLLEASVDPSTSKLLASDAPVIELVAEVVEPFGLGEVFADDDIAQVRSKTGKNPRATSTKTKGLKYQEASAQPNENAYQFLSRILTRLGVMLRMDPVGGGVYITAPHYDGVSLYSVAQARTGNAGGSDRFFGAVEVIDSNEGQFAEIVIIGAATDKPGATRATTPRSTVRSEDINADRPPYRSTSLPYKPRFHRDASCRDIDRAVSVGKLVLGLSAERAFQVRGRVPGLVSLDGTPWTIDTLGDVFIEALAFSEQMWLAERTMSVGADGQHTELVWIPKGNLTLGEVPS